MEIADTLKRLEKLVVDNSPAILTVLGVTGTITTAYLTGKATFRAAEIIDKYESKESGIWVQAGTKERFDLVWKLYVPAVGSGVLTVVCIVGANKIDSRRAAAVAAAYSLSERAFSEYKEKVVEKLGPKKEEAVRDEIAQDRINRNPLGDREVIITGPGEVLCYDAYTGRYFNSSMEKLRKAQNDINEEILHNMYASLGDFYSKIGLKPTSYSEEFGWNSDHLLQLRFSTTLSDDDKPCIHVDYNYILGRNFNKLHLD